MFCPNCGAQLPDDSKFCPNCGAAIEATEAPKAEEAPKEAPKAEEAPKAAPKAKEAPKAASDAAPKKGFGPAPIGSMKTFGPKGAFRLPDIPGFVLLGIANIVFFVSYFTMVGFNLNKYMGGGSGWLGVGGFFLILASLIVPVFFAYFFIDFAKLTNNKIPEKLLVFLPIAYYGLVALDLLFVLLGSLFTRGMHPSFWWYLELLFLGGAVVFTLLPALLGKVVGIFVKKK